MYKFARCGEGTRPNISTKSYWNINKARLNMSSLNIKLLIKFSLQQILSQAKIISKDIIIMT